MDSINNENENENKIDTNDRYLIANNSADIIWIESSERKYKTTKSSINYDMRIYIDIPYEADDELRINAKQLNELRPLNSFDRVSDERRTEMMSLQKKCVFLWIRYWCKKIIERRTSIPSFIKFETYFQTYFINIMNQYIRCTINAQDDIFEQFTNRLNQIEFIHNNNNNNN
eukprot:241852_1